MLFSQSGSRVLFALFKVGLTKGSWALCGWSEKHCSHREYSFCSRVLPLTPLQSDSLCLDLEADGELDPVRIACGLIEPLARRSQDRFVEWLSVSTGESEDGPDCTMTTERPVRLLRLDCRPSCVSKWQETP